MITAFGGLMVLPRGGELRSAGGECTFPDLVVSDFDLECGLLPWGAFESLGVGGFERWGLGGFDLWGLGGFDRWGLGGLEWWEVTDWPVETRGFGLFVGFLFGLSPP